MNDMSWEILEGVYSPEQVITAAVGLVVDLQELEPGTRSFYGERDVFAWLQSLAPDTNLRLINMEGLVGIIEI